MYWVYENWVASKKAVIHFAECAHCNDGRGVHRNNLGDKNGRWHGAFDTYNEALDLANSLADRTVRECSHCRPGLAAKR